MSNLSQLFLIRYDKNQCEEIPNPSWEQCFAPLEKDYLSWIHFQGKPTLEELQPLADHFQIHPVVLDDITESSGRSKFEDYDTHLFFSLKVPTLTSSPEEMPDAPFFMVTLPNTLITFSILGECLIKPIYQKLSRPQSRTRRQGSDFLGHVLLDMVVDRYFHLLEGMNERFEELEEPFPSDDEGSMLHKTLLLKKETAYLRRSAWPLRESISHCITSDSKLISKTTRVHLKQVYGHALYVIETIDAMRDILSGLTDIHLSQSNQKMNEVIKVLTVFTAIFAPLNFITGLYGTNFAYLPGSDILSGFYRMLIAMLFLSCIMLYAFKRKKWI
ncbi:MAG: magnesium and cobalt transport protein corA [Chlamydiales bacterium]|jgi:magnesium transporter|nr:magnesium and cobalt transport protein corA [Chlamydiales bacterium]